MAYGSNFRIATAFLLLMLIATHVAPISLGLSFWPLPFGPPAESAPANWSRMPAYLTAVDNFSFPHIDWPWRNTERNFLTAGELPLWNPYASLGLPFGPQYENQLFLPLEWIEIFGEPRLWNALLVAKILIAGVGTMLLVRRFCATIPATFAGGLFYSYSGYFLWFNTVPGFINAAAATPWLFLAIANLFDREMSPSRRTGQLALSIGFIWLCGQPQIAALSSLAVGAVFVGCWIAVTNRIQILVLALCGTILGFLIAAPQLLSFFGSLGRIYTLHPPTSYNDSGTLPLNFTLPVWPFLFGQLMTPWDPQLFPSRLNWEGLPLVAGSSGFLASILGLGFLISPGKTGRRPVLLCMITAIGLLSFAILICGTAGWSIWRPAGLDRVNFPRYITPVLSVFVAVTCAWGVENFRSASPRRLLLPPLLLFLSMLLTASVVWPIAGSQTALDRTYLYASLVLGIAPSALVLLTWCAIALVLITNKAESNRAMWPIAILAAGELMLFVRLGFDTTSELLRLVPLAFACVCAFALVLRRVVLANAALAAVLGGSVAILIFAEHRLAPVWDAYRHPPRYITFLQSMAGWREGLPRILTSRSIMVPNVGNAFGLSQLASLNPVQVDRSARFILEALATKPLDYTLPNAWSGLTPSPAHVSWEDYLARRSIYNALAVAFLVDSPSGPLSQINDASIRLVYRDEVAIYRDERAMPRAYAIDAAQLVGSLDEAIAAMRAAEFEPHRQAVVEAPSTTIPAAISGNSRGGITPLSITAFGSTRVDVDLAGGTYGLAVLSDAYYPGWTAEVDGQSRDIHIVNGVFRGVLVRPGDKLLTFHFMPPGLLELLILSLLAWAFSITLVLVPLTITSLLRLTASLT
jgi:hypothetical protein